MKASRPTLYLLGLMALLQAGPGLACTLPEGAALEARDRARLEALAESRLRGLAAALLSPSEVERAAIAGLYEPATTVPDAEAIAGTYRCRTVKLGGLLPATVYDFFACRIAAGADGITISKTSGSQRFSGSLEPAADGLVYRGALHYGDEAPIGYGEDAERDQVGCLVALPDGRLRLDLPSPQFESVHDAIELVPRR